MILKMIHDAQLSKDDRKKFVPFVNQRNHMGAIIKTKQRDKQHFKSIQVFQNLKKTSQQYFFDKKYQKMKQKLDRCQRSLEPREPNYDNEVTQCFKALQKSTFFHSQYTNESNLQEANKLFVDLNQKLNENISTLKEEIQKNKISRTDSHKYKSVYQTDNRTQTLKYPAKSLSRLNFNPSKQNEAWGNEGARRKTLTNSKQKDYLNIAERKVTRPINRELFRDISSQSQKMTDFTNYGLKYRHLVKAEKKDPWKKWYVNSKIEIFPGQTVNVRKLQKSIYD